MKIRKPKKPKINKPELISEKNRRAGILTVFVLLAVPGFIYGGFPFLIPYAATVGMYYLCQWLMPEIARPMFAGFAFHVGLIVFRIAGLVGVLFQGGAFEFLLWVDTLLALALLVWLMWKPNLWAALFLLIYDAMMLLSTFDAMDEGIIALPMLLFRLVWPVAAAIFMFIGLFRIEAIKIPVPNRRQRAQELSKLVLKAPRKDNQQLQEPRQDPISNKRKKRKG